MLIVLEGTDCAGKSTLVDQLRGAAQRLGFHDDDVRTLHAGPPTPETDPLDEYELGLVPWRPLIHDPRGLLILDRWHLGEVIYGPLLRGASRLDRVQLAHLELFLDALGALRIVVDPGGDDVLLARLQVRLDDLVTHDQAVEARRRYLVEGAMLRWRCTSSPVSREMVYGLLASAGVRANEARWLAPFPGYVGNPRPLALLVGDQPSGYRQGQAPNPAFMPYGQNSAHFLLSALQDAGRASAYGTYGLANANDGTDLTALWDTLCRPRVVALGARAARALTLASVPYSLVPHPQWQRRFKHHDRPAYGHLVAEAAAGTLGVTDQTDERA